jgi:hypothetical protein
MTPSELKHNIESTRDESYFFSCSTMKSFGDTMSNYGVRPATVLSSYDSEGNYSSEPVERGVWELYRKRPVKHGLRSSAYFDKKNFDRVFANT